jgi:4-hydroxybenzoate polyprenyltransferase
LLRKSFDFFIFSSLYISAGAVVMTYQTQRLLLHGLVSYHLLGFVLFSTVCSYNFHWYLSTESVSYSRRIEWTKAHKVLHLLLYIGGLAGAAFFFFALREFWPALFFGAFVTFLYSAPKIPQHFFRGLQHFAVGKTLFLSFVWMYVTTILPVVVSRQPWQPAFVLFVCSRFFLIYAICVVFDYRDREDDKKNGVRSMITFLNENGIDTLFWFSLSLFAIFTLALYRYDHHVLTEILLLVPGIIMASLYKYAKKNFSDYLYYFVLDGLMMLSGLLMMIFTI